MLLDNNFICATFLWNDNKHLSLHCKIAAANIAGDLGAD